MRKISFLLSLVFIFMIPWENVVNLPGLGTAAKFMGLMVAAFWVVTIFSTGQFRKPSPFHILVFLFVLWNAVSIFWSADVNRSVDRLVTWVQLLVLAFILWDLYTTRTALLAGLQVYILGAYVAIGYTVYNYFSGSYHYFQRFSAADPNDFGTILALGIPVAWYLAASLNTTKLSNLFKIINYAYIPAAFVGITLSGSRTALIAAVPGMIFGLTLLTRIKLSARIAIILFVTSAIFVLQPFIPQTSFTRFGTIIPEITGGDLNQRAPIWRQGLDSFAEHPLFGVGSNMYRSVNSLGKVAHNSFLSVLVEVGLIGFVLFVSILAIAVVQAWGQPKWDKRFWLTILMVWAIGASALTWEYRKPTWLFLSLIIASAALTDPHEEVVQLLQHNELETQVMPAAQHTKSLPDEKETLYHV